MKPTNRFDLDSNSSAWLPDHPDDQPQPALRASIEADVAIIGGGFTGVSTAYYLSRRYPEKRIVLLEARLLANGASGRSGGQMLNWIYGMSDDPEQVQRIYHVTRGAIDSIAETIIRHALPVECSWGGVLRVQTSARRAEAAQALVERLRALGIPLEYVDQAALGSFVRIQGAHGAILDRSEGQINGVQFLRSLRDVLLEQGVSIYENTPVTRILEGRTIHLTTPEAEISAEAIVLATNAYTPRLGYFRHAVFPVICNVAATRPLSEDEQKQMGWHAAAGWGDDRVQLLYVSRSGDGRIVFGGGPAGYRYEYGGRTTSRATLDRQAQGLRRMHQLLLDYMPGLAGIPLSHAWSGPVAINLRGLSGMIGARGEHRNIYYALGYSGHGVVLANLAGQILTDMVSGDDQAWHGLPIVKPSVLPLPPEPFRWLGATLYMGLLSRGKRESLW